MEKFDITTDVVVIGAGGSGLPAALSAKEAGARDVTIVERRKLTGGTGAIIGHMFAVESRPMKERGITVTKDQVFQRHMESAHWACDARLARDFINASASMIDWLESKEGITFNHISATSGTTYKTSHAIREGNNIPVTGRVIADVLTRECKKAGVHFLMGTRAMHLIRNGEKKICGIVVSSKGKEIRIGAKAVIIATGSITANPALRKKFYPEKDFSNTEITASHPWINGDGYLMAKEVNCLGDPIMTTLYIGAYITGHMVGQMILSRPYIHLVNLYGKRFVNEDLMITNDDHSMIGSALDRQPKHMCFGLIDTASLRDMVSKHEVLSNFEAMFGQGVDDDIYNKAANTRVDGLISDEKNAGNGAAWLDHLESDLDGLAKDHPEIVKKTDSLDEIADFIGCSPKDFKDQINRINEHYDKQYDEEFLKNKRFLYPFRTPPYYVIKSKEIFLDSIFGGIRIDDKMRVIHESGYPFEGLYAAGIGVSGFIGSQGLGALDGTAYASSVYSGYVAGQEAAKYCHELKEKE
jgi:fumarate reductase flavoprotein subunit